jgi:microcystin-dependent protein
MTFHFTHPFVSAKADGTDPTVVRPTDWNADHAVTADGPGVVGRTASGSGPMSLLPIGNTYIPAGVGLPWFGAVGQIPAGWYLCDGSAKSRTVDAALYTAIGIAYGAGDGSTTFNVPDLRGRVPAGADGGVGRLTNATMSPDGNTPGAAGGAQLTSTNVNVNGPINVAASVSGPLNGVVDSNAPPDTFQTGPGGQHTVCAAFLAGTLQVQVNGSMGGNAAGNVSLNGATGNIDVVQPTLVVNWIIKA